LSKESKTRENKTRENKTTESGRCPEAELYDSWQKIIAACSRFGLGAVSLLA
jgi:hypothetical protein